MSQLAQFGIPPCGAIITNIELISVRIPKIGEANIKVVAPIIPNRYTIPRLDGEIVPIEILHLYIDRHRWCWCGDLRAIEIDILVIEDIPELLFTGFEKNNLPFKRRGSLPLVDIGVLEIVDLKWPIRCRRRRGGRGGIRGR